MPPYRAVRAADPRSVRGAGRTHAGRAAVARRCLPVVSRRHPGSLVFKAALCFPRPHAIPSYRLPRHAIAAAAGEVHTPLALNAVQTFLSLP
jgi:hypothetical protein